MGNTAMCCASTRDVDVSDIEDHSNSDNKKGNHDATKDSKADGLPPPVRRKVDAKKQRRRLSVAPDQVGDISRFQNKGRRFSSVGQQHIPLNEPKKFVAISKKGYVPYNKNKVNQDSYFCDYNFDGRDNCRLFGVCDGHGEYGHNVSDLVKRKLPKYLKGLDYLAQPEEAMRGAVAKVVETLRKSNINTTFSGTTLVFSLIVDSVCYTANIGDSRCIIVSQNKETQKIYAKPLSVDHKLDIAEEEERVLASGGRVAPLPGPVGEDPGPMRVWLADIDVPGLAMSRSLGDDVAHSVGVSNEPEITRHEIDAEDDLFLMYASDGIWEFIANEKAAEIVLDKLPDLREAALKLVKEAIARWRDEEEVIDDITSIIYNLSQEKAASTSNKNQVQQEPIQEKAEEPEQKAEPQATTEAIEEEKDEKKENLQSS